MYNEQRKTDFLTGMNRSNKFKGCTYTLFKTSEPFEAEWGCDLTERPKDDIQKIINKLPISNYEMSRLYISILRRYIAWSKDRGYEVHSTLVGTDFDYTKSDLDAAGFVASPLHLEHMMDELVYVDPYDPTVVKPRFAPVEDGTVDILRRTFLWLAFCGIDSDDVFNIKTSDVDFIGMVIRHGRRIYEIYREAVPALHAAVTRTTFVNIHENPYYKIEKPRVDSDALMRGCVGKHVGIRGFTTVIHRKFDLVPVERETNAVERRVSYQRVYLSGIFYRWYECERAGRFVDFDDVDEDMKYRYERWKKSF